MNTEQNVTTYTKEDVDRLLSSPQTWRQNVRQHPLKTIMTLLGVLLVLWFVFFQAEITFTILGVFMFAYVVKEVFMFGKHIVKELDPRNRLSNLTDEERKQLITEIKDDLRKLKEKENQNAIIRIPPTKQP